MSVKKNSMVKISTFLFLDTPWSIIGVAKEFRAQK
jgi:hypothetical protein